MDYELAAKIDHTLLKADATRADILRVCEEAKTYHTASVCVNAFWVPVVAKALAGSGVKTCCVVGFPLGAMSSAAKAFEAREAVAAGAQEVDMVLNVGLARGGEWDAVEADIAAVVQAAGQATVKVILETCLLTDAQKRRACVFHRRGDGSGRAPDARGRRPGHGREGVWRHPHPRGRRAHAGGGRQPHRRERHGQDRRLSRPKARQSCRRKARARASAASRVAGVTAYSATFAWPRR